MFSLVKAQLSPLMHQSACFSKILSLIGSMSIISTADTMTALLPEFVRLMYSGSGGGLSSKPHYISRKFTGF
jgi:hypothetical protein